MLVINKDFIERCSDEYDRRTQGTYDQIEETAILNWLSQQGQPRFLNKEYFIRLGRWKTPRYQATRATNHEQDIINTTHSAYLAKDDLEKLNILRKLKGVGIAVASTILYYLQPDKFAIFDYHVLNPLKKAGKLSKGAKVDSKKVWFKYTQIIRGLSTLHNKTLREIEKALFAYDKWGCGDNEDDSREREIDKDTNGKKTEVPLLQSSGGGFVGGTIIKPGYYSDRTERQEIEIWPKCFKVLPYRKYPLDITLIIKQCEYEAILRFSESHQTAWIPAHLNINNKKYRLVDALRSGGFARGQVELKIIGKRIWVVKQLTVAKQQCTVPKSA